MISRSGRTSDGAGVAGAIDLCSSLLPSTACEGVVALPVGDDVSSADGFIPAAAAARSRSGSDVSRAGSAAFVVRFTGAGALSRRAGVAAFGALGRAVAGGPFLTMGAAVGRSFGVIGFAGGELAAAGVVSVAAGVVVSAVDGVSAFVTVVVETERGVCFEPSGDRKKTVPAMAIPTRTSDTPANASPFDGGGGVHPRRPSS